MELFVFHFYTVMVKSTKIKKYLRSIKKKSYLHPVYMLPDWVDTLLCCTTYYLDFSKLFYSALQWIKNMLFLVSYRWWSSNLYHSSSITCNTLRCLRTEAGCRKHCVFSPGWLVGCFPCSHGSLLRTVWTSIPCYCRSLASPRSLSPTQCLWHKTDSWGLSDSSLTAHHRRVRLTFDSFQHLGQSGYLHDPQTIISLHSHIHTLRNVRP